MLSSPITMSSPTSSSSSPHTPAGSVITAVKATARSPFFHARLQRGLRLNERDPDTSGSPEPEFYSLSPSPDAASYTPSRVSNDEVIAAVPDGKQQAHNSSISGNGCDENRNALAARGVPTLKVNTLDTRNLRAQTSSSSLSSSSKLSPHTAATHFSSSSTLRYPSSGPNSAMPVATADPDFWESVKDAAVPAPTGPRGHYLTRSQSSGATGVYQSVAAAPKLRKKGSSIAAENTELQYTSHSPSPLRSEYDPKDGESVDITSGVRLANHRQLSPITESPFSIDYRNSPIHGDTASIHSIRSDKSKLFINRPVRRTTSASSFNSQNSIPPRGSPLVDEGGTGTLGLGRHRTALSMIPGSPRASNVHDLEPEETLKFPMPAAHPEEIVYDPFPQSQDDLHQADLRDLAGHSRTPSLLTMSRTASQSTQLTYLTADEAGNARRSRADGGTGAAGRRSQLGGSPRERDRDRERGDNASLPRSAAARFKSSIEDLLSKSSRMTSTAIKRPIASVAPPFRGALTLLSTARSPWAVPQSKPSEVLFWTGFIAPWCWLIGGWMLSRSGETVMEGLPRGAKEENFVLPLYTNVNAAATLETQEQLQGLGSRSQSPARFSDMQTHTQTQTQTYTHTQEGKGLSSIWKHAKSSSAELLASVRIKHVEDENPQLKPMHLRGDDVTTETMTNARLRLDPWVLRCRVAAIVSGMLLLALLIVALVVLIRAL